MSDHEQRQDAEEGTIVGAPGQRLSSARAQKGMTLEAVSESTGIPRAVLEALEANEWDALDAPVYVKGYLRKYAKLLELDQGEIIDAYETAAVPSDPEIHAYVSEHLPTERSVRWLIPVTGLIILAFAVLVGLWGWHRFHAHSQHAQAPASAVSAMMALTDTAPAQASGHASVLPTPQTQAGQSKVDRAAAGTASGLHLHLQVEQPSWVEVYGPARKRLYYNLAAAGAALDFHAAHGALTIFLGNAPGVKVKVNGSDFPIPASDITGHTARFKVHVDTASPASGTQP